MTPKLYRVENHKIRGSGRLASIRKHNIRPLNIPMYCTEGASRQLTNTVDAEYQDAWQNNARLVQRLADSSRDNSATHSPLSCF